MRIILFAPALVLAGYLAQHPLCAQTVSPEWAVEDVWAPTPHHPDDRFSWQSLYPAGDIDGDGLTDLASLGVSTPGFFSGRSVWDYLRYSSGICAKLPDEFFIPKPLSTIEFEFTKLELNTPSGRVILLDDRAIPMIEVYDVSSGLLIGSIQQPPPPAPGVPPTQGMEWIFPAGDVNHDGYDDAFYQTYSQPYGYCGLIDGATLTVAWQRYGTQVDAIVIFYNGLAAPQPDLDDDGTSDLLFGQVLWNGLQYGHRMTALSGQDGSTIWERVGAQYPSFRQACGRDLDADGVGDILMVLGESAGPTIHAWSGRTGATLWTFSSLMLDSKFPPGAYGRNFRSPLMSQGVGTAREEIVFHAEYIYNSGPYVNRLVHLDGATGMLLDVVELPLDIQPWSGDLLEGSVSTLYLDPAGDCDRDGFQEYAVHVPAPSHWPIWSNFPSQQYVFLGQQNLLMPSSARIGTSVQANLSVPSAPNFDFLLLASTTFDPAGGLSVQGWNTHLKAQDPFLQQTWTSRALNGQLGPQGNGSRAVRIPNQSSLIGKRLYFRALVRNPATGEVWTRSSLAQVDVLP